MHSSVFFCQGHTFNIYIYVKLLFSSLLNSFVHIGNKENSAETHAVLIAYIAVTFRTKTRIYIRYQNTKSVAHFQA